MATEDKLLQKTIVNLAKARDFTGLVGLMKGLSNPSESQSPSFQSVKLAINICANLLVDVDPEFPMLESFHGTAMELVTRFPVLSEFENVTYAIIKTKLRLDAIHSAVEMALACKEPRLRLYSVILEYCGKQGDRLLALVILDEIDKRQLVPTEADFASVIHSFRRLDRAAFLSSVDTLLHRVLAAHDVLQSRSIVEAIGQHGLTKWDDITIGVERMDRTCGLCPSSGIRLHQEELSDAELDEMIELTRRLSFEASALKQELNPFDSVISSMGDRLPTVILDAANIAHTNQNFDGGYFRFDQIEDILAHFRSDAKCLVVVHEKWLNPARELKFPQPVTDESGTKSQKRKRKPALPQLGQTLVEGRPVIESEMESQIELPKGPKEIERRVPVDLIETWRINGELLVVPHGQNDDWFWMHICLLSVKRLRGTVNVGSDVPRFVGSTGLREGEIVLVSNDQMRDHFWRMKNPGFFARFRSNHVCGYSITYGEDLVNHYEYQLPNPFSVSIQKNGACWHLPYVTESGIRWFAFSTDK